MDTKAEFQASLCDHHWLLLFVINMHSCVHACALPITGSPVAIANRYYIVAKQTNEAEFQATDLQIREYKNRFWKFACVSVANPSTKEKLRNMCALEFPKEICIQVPLI